MTLTQYTARVNQLMREEVERYNTQHAQGEILFGATHVDYPESMMKYYRDEGYTPEEVIQALEDEAEAEGRWEAMVS